MDQSPGGCLEIGPVGLVKSPLVPVTFEDAGCRTGVGAIVFVQRSCILDPNGKGVKKTVANISIFGRLYLRPEIFPKTTSLFGSIFREAFVSDQIFSEKHLVVR